MESISTSFESRVILNDVINCNKLSVPAMNTKSKSLFSILLLSNRQYQLMYKLDLYKYMCAFVINKLMQTLVADVFRIFIKNISSSFYYLQSSTIK